jgi:hypothetical protein
MALAGAVKPTRGVSPENLAAPRASPPAEDLAPRFAEHNVLQICTTVRAANADPDTMLADGSICSMPGFFCSTGLGGRILRLRTKEGIPWLQKLKRRNPEETPHTTT